MNITVVPVSKISKRSNSEYALFYDELEQKGRTQFASKFEKKAISFRTAIGTRFKGCIHSTMEYKEGFHTVTVTMKEGINGKTN